MMGDVWWPFAVCLIEVKLYLRGWCSVFTTNQKQESVFCGVTLCKNTHKVYMSMVSHM